MKTSIYTVLRFAAYTAVIVCLAASLPLLLRNGSALSFGENQFIEWIESALLLAVSLVALWGGYRAPASRRVMFLLASVAIFATCRELDMLLDVIVPVIGWKVGGIVLVFGAWRTYIHRREFIRQLDAFLRSQAFALLWAGFILAAPFAQLIGYAGFLKQLMGDDYMRDYRRVIQESAELFGYVLLVAGALEGVIRDEQNRV